MKNETMNKDHQVSLGAGTMKALVYERYGTPDVLRIEEVDIPKPMDHEVLIAVHAASVNSWDWDLLLGKPYINRLGGLRKPRYRILGADIAGRVVAVGAAVKRFRQGDEVFGDISGCGWGGFAEYVCANEEALTQKPEGLSFEQAAAIPRAGVLALQGLRVKGKLLKGYQVLINGAGGGVGTFGIQYAKLLGAEVTGVDRGEKLEALRSVGADHVLDYTMEDFTAGSSRYDLILDVVGNRSVFAIKRALKTGGTYVMVGGPIHRVFQVLLAAPLTAWLEKKKVGMLLHKPNHNDQLVWKSLIEAGHVMPVIDRRYSLRDAAQALEYFGEGRVIGKVVVSMKPQLH
ncbi:NADPH:quinone reductase-like Zn-dependent oxidoreductase [Paenibacillus endophyticus]|uniref:NADPH:quinone reductase-like Zn-dependent oxidoreductase n=1 Tax=Paenibacillus endophyticus TaxID=1294268 RepID=A0A7W5C7L5_9BACL|nr:NAD(P)-dependent alcohol dehydrogenase [Paenibacillus endophyticus]MBB3152160.1 NADPH:quinone reductase-like Zn-dependent oxidoreductase [Paenibacillus endophyticus]